MASRRVRAATLQVEAETPDGSVERLLALCGGSAAEGVVLVARRGDEVLGVAVLRLGAADAEILGLVTDPLHRHRGVGARLVADMARRARVAGCRLLRVRLRRSDDATAGFFRALGFDDTAVALDLGL